MESHKIVGGATVSFYKQCICGEDKTEEPEEKSISGFQHAMEARCYSALENVYAKLKKAIAEQIRTIFVYRKSERALY